MDETNDNSGRRGISPLEKKAIKIAIGAVAVAVIYGVVWSARRLYSYTIKKREEKYNH